MNCLLGYASEDEETPPHAEPKKRKESPTLQSEDAGALKSRKKRKLPPLPSSLSLPVPESDPSKHQGRVRTQPHVEGQFASYVYIPVSLARDVSGGLGGLVGRAVKLAKGAVPSINPIVDDRCELHVSLSRPVYLRHHQREDFRRAIKTIASSHEPFSASFATFATFINDEQTRTFLALEVGAGHSQFHDLAEGLTPTLRSLYQKEYYAEPRFHASFAWALLAAPPECQPNPAPETLSDADAQASTQLQPCRSEEFPTVSELPPALLASLNDDLGERLQERGEFSVSEICVRIGKEVKTYPLCSR